MLRLILIAVLMGIVSSAAAQQNPKILDSLKNKLAHDKTPEEKFQTLGLLSRLAMNVSPQEADVYGRMMSEQAELSRNRSLMVRALLIHGERFSYMMGKKDAVQKSIDYYHQAVQLARKSRLEKEMAEGLLGLSAVHQGIPDLDKALNYTTQASSVIS